MNQCDSQSLRDELFEYDWSEAENIEDAGLCVINTCCVMQSADRKSRNSIHEILKKKKSQARVLVTGCCVNYDKSVLEKIRCIDLIFQINEKERLSNGLRQNFPGFKRIRILMQARLLFIGQELS